MKKLALSLSILAAVAVTPASAWADPASSSSGSSSDLSSAMQVAIQLAQQTYAQAVQMLSNIMKSDSDTSSSIVGNLKN